MHHYPKVVLTWEIRERMSILIIMVQTKVNSPDIINSFYGPFLDLCVTSLRWQGHDNLLYICSNFIGCPHYN